MVDSHPPDPSRLIERIHLKTPLIAFSDAPDPEWYAPLIRPGSGECIFSFFKDWLEGKTLHLTRDCYGCGGAGNWMWGIQIRKKEDFLEFLVDQEGLKANHDLMEKWIDSRRPYNAQHSHLFIGPFKENLWEHIKTITFYVNPDQLSLLVIGAQYHSKPEDPPPVIAPFGSGCMLLHPFDDLDISQAALGATDIAMRQHLPPNLLAFTVTRTMFRRLCGLDHKSFLYKPFLKGLWKARKLK